MMNDSPDCRGQQWLESLLKLAGLSAEVTARIDRDFVAEDENTSISSYWLTIDETNLRAKDIEALIGKNGNALDAIQYLANSALNLNQPGESQASYTIELGGYRVARQAEIFEVATSAANEVRTSGREVEIQSLSSAERRQVHTYLRNYTDLETFSRGKEPNRNLVVRPAEH
ncbi:RNA-binding protein [Mastigocoleus testarum BC008]|uniref:RNA-binding protein n=2 Tax=Mastigocoleus TaxID=996924 RepID=A0A0V8A002_9CYAN|nr:RNA-binding protein [Mastigocoleus testarum BC008]